MEETTQTEEVKSEEVKAKLSLKEFSARPYQQTYWATVGEHKSGAGFLPMDINVIEGEAVGDDFFVSFDPPKQEKKVEAAGVPSGLTEADLQKKYEEGIQAGILEGEKKAKAQFDEELAQLREQLKAFSNQLGEQTKNLYTHVEREALAMSLHIAHKILATTTEIKPEYIVDVIKKGIEKLGASVPLKIHVSEQDYDFLKIVGVPAELSSLDLAVQYEIDDKIKSGCVIETNFGEINLEIDKMWEEIKNKLYEVS